jgi:hypothetical protein
MFTLSKKEIQTGLGTSPSIEESIYLLNCQWLNKCLQNQNDFENVSILQNLFSPYIL